MENCQDDKSECGGRREFLVKASALAGGLVLSLSGAAGAKEKVSAQTTDTGNEVALKLTADSPLNKVGGSQTVDTKAGKVVVVRVDDATFKAYSAVCPHKGGPIKYDTATKQLFCPWHNSRFDETGKVVKGPARADLTAYAADTEVVVTLGAPKA